MTSLTHLDSEGKARMVDVTPKGDTVREAVAKSTVIMKPSTLQLIKAGGVEKGDVLSVARVAGIMAAKQTPHLIPLCHPLLINNVAVDFDLSKDDSIGITAKVKCTGKTGVEMEALVAASVAALTIYDMCKAVDKGMTIAQTYLESKSGGKSGTYRRTG
jgi:cyclic pyranopterin phosphate synthase